MKYYRGHLFPLIFRMIQKVVVVAFLRLENGALKGPDQTQGDPGTNAIDIQTSRSTANDVVNATNSVGIGTNVQVTGYNNVAIGLTPKVVSGYNEWQCLCFFQ